MLTPAPKELYIRVVDVMFPRTFGIADKKSGWRKVLKNYLLKTIVLHRYHNAMLIFHKRSSLASIAQLALLKKFSPGSD